MIRDQISTIIGVRIPQSGYRNIFEQLQISGGLDQKKLIEIILLLIEEAEKHEDL